MLFSIWCTVRCVSQELEEFRDELLRLGEEMAGIRQQAAETKTAAEQVQRRFAAAALADVPDAKVSRTHALCSRTRFEILNLRTSAFLHFCARLPRAVRADTGGRDQDRASECSCCLYAQRSEARRPPPGAVVGEQLQNCHLPCKRRQAFFDHCDVTTLLLCLALQNEDDDVAVVGAGGMQTRCPMTQAVMTQPLLNKNCKHYYSPEGFAMLQRKLPLRCPICRRGFRVSDVVPDEEMAFRIAEYVREQEQLQSQQQTQMEAEATLID